MKGTGDLMVGERSRVPRVRSALFTPADREDFVARVGDRGADGVILDLEDSVPEDRKDVGRAIAGRWIRSRDIAERPTLFVRVNRPTEALEADIEHVVARALRCVVLPKVRSPGDVLALDSLLSYYEGQADIPRGQVRIWPLLESAEGISLAYEIARCSPRVAYMGGGAGEEGDLAGELRFRFGDHYLETLFLRSKVLLDVRRAGIENPMSGMVTRFDDDSITSFAAQTRRLGYEGMMVIHPRHVEPVNAAFTPTRDEVLDARGILDALKEAQLAGRGSISYRGRMLDAAMAKNARLVLEMAGESPS